MIATIIAIVGTLAGAALSALVQGRQQRTALVGTETVARRQAAVDAVADLVAAVSAHRSAMWHRESLRLAGQDWTEARTASHASRAAITAPAVRLAVLLPALRPAADAAAHASYALRGADTTTVLDAAREASLAADQHLVAEAGRLLGI
ncbi:protein kilB [Streptomyces sp. NPDC002514]|uniref:protein kilB n=1 Tax=Streptomyces sp. NPDC001270 TaxID=3364554 RepID=UPI00369FBAA2